jgi:hypothetical protein
VLGFRSTGPAGAEAAGVACGPLARSVGYARTVTRGVKMGRLSKITPQQRKEALRRLGTGEPTRDIALTYNVHHSAISRPR